MTHHNPYPWAVEARQAAPIHRLFQALVEHGSAGLGRERAPAAAAIMRTSAPDALAPVTALAALNHLAIPDADDPLTGDRLAAATVHGLHSVRRTLTYNTVAEYDPATGAFAVPLGGAPHLYRSMRALAPSLYASSSSSSAAAAATAAASGDRRRKRDDDADADADVDDDDGGGGGNGDGDEDYIAETGEAGFCVAADTHGTHCDCMAIIEHVTVEDVCAPLARLPPRTIEAVVMLHRDNVFNTVRMAPVLYMRYLSGATAAAAAGAAVMTPAAAAAAAAAPAVAAAAAGTGAVATVPSSAWYASLLRQAWFDVHQNTAYAAAGAVAHQQQYVPSGPPAAANAAGTVDTSLPGTLKGTDVPLAYRDTYATLQSVAARHAPVTVFRLPYGYWDELLALARTRCSDAPGGDLLTRILRMPATSSRYRTLLLACHVYTHWRDIVPPSAWRMDNVRTTNTAAAERAFAWLVAQNGGVEAPVVGAILRGKRALGAEAAAAAQDASHLALQARRDAIMHLANVNYSAAVVVQAARDLRDTLYPTWDASVGSGSGAEPDARAGAANRTLWLRWHINPVDAEAIRRVTGTVNATTEAAEREAEQRSARRAAAAAATAAQGPQAPPQAPPAMHRYGASPTEAPAAHGVAAASGGGGAKAYLQVAARVRVTVRFVHAPNPRQPMEQ